VVNQKKTSKRSDQIEGFKDTARTLECDLSEDAFDRALDKIGKAKPQPVAKQTRRKTKR
jgi:hypothetical protein